jgi:D-glycero-alpha-D-manno-heptose-7-phosphate kinase
MSSRTVEASAPARIDLAGGTLDLWPLHVLHPGSVTVNVAIDRRAACRVRTDGNGILVETPERGLQRRAVRASDLLDDPATALVGSMLEALGAGGPLEIALSSGVPWGSGLGGSSALTIALSAAFERLGWPRPSGASPVEFARDVETRVLGKPAGVQDYYPPLEGGLHALWFEAGCVRSERRELDVEQWGRHLTLFDTGAAHSSGMNNWEVFRTRLEGDGLVAGHLEGVRAAAVGMAEAAAALDFEAMGRALDQEWEARRLLAPVVSTPSIEAAIDAARRAGAWGGKACGAGGGGCVVFLSPEHRTASVARALAEGGFGGRVLRVAVENRGVAVSASAQATV